jgi:hypothetical protein
VIIPALETFEKGDEANKLIQLPAPSTVVAPQRTDGPRDDQSVAAIGMGASSLVVRSGSSAEGGVAMQNQV